MKSKRAESADLWSGCGLELKFVHFFKSGDIGLNSLEWFKTGCNGLERVTKVSIKSKMVTTGQSRFELVDICQNGWGCVKNI